MRPNRAQRGAVAASPNAGAPKRTAHKIHKILCK
nr:MAG TPA: hypothetical protein [Caudoviricetes sp.]